MKIVKASAGSGKTYTLSHTYLDLLMQARENDAYRHILAVTFTNKATDEMKSRILKDLNALAETNPRARDILVDILNDYGAFSVSTIDAFFQRALKVFSREIGQFSSYQVELDRDSLISETIDRILDSLTENDTELVEWLKSSVMSKIEQGSRFAIEDGLMDMGKMLKSEELRDLAGKYGVLPSAAFSRSRMAEIRKACRHVIDDFHKLVHDRAVAVEPTIAPKAAKAREMLKVYTKELKNYDKVERPKPTLSKACPDSPFLDCFGERFKLYNTAKMLDSTLFSLGIAGEFYKEFDALLKEKSVMPLDDSNTILKDIIDGSDAPFVYEKMGVRYNTFLLDEFQDTSLIQWDNFLPLLKESESRSGGSLVVGDVKQSIYRWRNSDWNLLRSRVEAEFPGSQVKTLDCNWRSAPNVVEFNNAFFEFAAERLHVSNLYSDVRQKAMDNDSADTRKGRVKVSFVEDQMAELMESLADARSRSAWWGDIAILVRNKKEGAAIAAELIRNGIPVISDDSLAMKSSVVLRRLCSLLSFIENPDNEIGSFLAKTMNIEYPDSYHSLVDLCEGLLRSLKLYDPKSFEGETLFVQAFMDALQSWVDVNGNNLMLFLKHWNESDPYIGSPEDAAAVRILTVHKSKGLEFPFVIFPYAEKVNLFKSGVHWCRLDASGTALDCASGIYPVNLCRDTSDTLFAADYEREAAMQVVDNLNIYYVSLTRAVKELHIISKLPTKTFVDSLDKGVPDYKCISDILYEFGSKSTGYEIGSPYDYALLSRKSSSEDKPFPAQYVSVPIGDRLSASEDVMDFFGEDGLAGAAASARLNGIVLHDILSRVELPSELRKAVDDAVHDGQLDSEGGEKAFALLSDRVASHPEWFREGMTVSNETSVYDVDGREYRPDRVIVEGDSVTIIDYKFGEEHKTEYGRQVKRYCDLYARMGYKKISGHIWYVPENHVEKIV